MTVVLDVEGLERFRQRLCVGRFLQQQLALFDELYVLAHDTAAMTRQVR